MNENEMLRDEEISLYDLVQPLLANWKLVAAATLLGVLAGTAGIWVKGYEAELKAKPVAKLNFVEWRSISAGLPALAESRFVRAQSSGETEDLYRTFASSAWWTKNVLPQYRYSKTDIRELVAITREEQERGATRIDYVVFRGIARVRSDAVSRATGTEHFVREGGLMLALKSLVEQKDLRSRRVTPEVQAKIAEGEVELGYLRKRAAVLKNLAQQYPDSQSVTLQSVLDPKGDSARFLPVGVQIVAVEREIADLEEMVARSRDELEAAQVMRAFVERALPLVASDPEGFALAEHLKEVESEVRKGIDPTNKVQVAAIERLGSELNSINERFKSLFEARGLVSVRRSGGLLLVLGMLGGGLFGVVFVLFRSAWRRALRDHEARGAA